MAKFMRNYLISWIDIEKGEKYLIGDRDWQKKDGWVYPNLLTINLDVNRNTFAAANECHLQIYNLSRSHRQAIYHDRYRPDKVIWLEIMAGYGQNLSLIFTGKVLQSYSYMQGNDMITDIQALDAGFMEYVKEGGRRVNYTSMTLEAGTLKKDAIKRIVADMEEGTQVGGIGKIGDESYQTPVSFLGNSFMTIDEITGGHCFVDLGRVNILSDKEILDVGVVPLINAETGLLGTPMRRDGQLEVDVLFEPSYVVGQGVKMETITGVDQFNGLFKVIGIHHTGTISAATCGTLKTRLNLWYGNKLPQTDSTYVSNEESFSKVKGEDVTPVIGTTPKSCQDVYDWIKMHNGEVPNWFVGNTTIGWRDVISDGARPELWIINNLYQICGLVQEVIGIGTKINVNNGYRTPAENQDALGAKESWHLQGKALDITGISGFANTRKMYAYFVKFPNIFGELLDETSHLHIATGAGRRGAYNNKRFKELVSGRDY